MRRIRTVTGDFPTETLGHCQCHEHLFIAKGKSYEVNPALWMDDKDASLNELNIYKGAGGSSLAISLYLTQAKWGDNVPSKIILANRSVPRLETAKQKLQDLNTKVRFEFIHGPTPKDNDAVMQCLKPYSLVVNATGLGKDAPGSTITDDGIFPENSLIWEINYRGELDFMHQSIRQKEKRNLYIEDGWIYFIHGWTQVVGEVFDIPIVGEKLNICNDIAMEMRK